LIANATNFFSSTRRSHAPVLAVTPAQGRGEVSMNFTSTVWPTSKSLTFPTVRNVRGTARPSGATTKGHAADGAEAEARTGQEPSTREDLRIRCGRFVWWGLGGGLGDPLSGLGVRLRLRFAHDESLQSIRRWTSLGAPRQ
jgi:hypothetical protein